MVNLMNRKRAFLCVVVASAVFGLLCRGIEAFAVDADAATQIGRLEDNDFSVRDEARRRLQQLATDPKTGGEVGRLIEAKLADKTTSLEVREVLQSLLKARG